MTTSDPTPLPGITPEDSSRSRKRPQAGAPGRTAARRIFVDRAARWIVTAGGMAIIASILGILFFILLKVLPLVRSAHIAIGRTVPVGQEVEALTVDEYQTHAALLEPGGRIQVVRLSDGKVVDDHQLTGEGLLDARVPPGGTAFTASTNDGRVVAQTVSWRSEFDAEGQRSVVPEFAAPVEVILDPERRPLG